MADINVNVVLPEPITVDVTSPTKSIQANVFIPGPQGPIGPIGPSGFSGLQGETGPQGPSGLQGIQGPSGLRGSDGTIDTGVFDLRYYSNTNPSGFITGVDLTPYATNINLALTGSTLDTKINLLSGVSVLTFGNQDITGLKNFTSIPTVNTIPVLLSGQNANGLNVFVKNDDSINLSKGQPVYIYGANGNNILVRLARNSGEATSSKTLGLLAQDLNVNAQGYVITEGGLEGIYTSSANPGDPVWLGATGNLIFGLTNKPYAPNHLVYLGVVERQQSNNGKIYVKIQNGFELQELHNVNLDHSYSLNNQDILRYNSTSGLWFNQQLNTGALGSGIDQIKINLTLTGVNIDNKINSLSGVITGDYYLKSNPSGFITEANLSNYVTKTSGQFTDRPIVNGTGVLLSGEAANLPNTIVYSTGNQTISGIKTFDNTGVFNTLSISNKQFTSYGYFTGNFNFDNNLINLTNSSNDITGTLPSNVESGINYYVKNLNTGVLLITGSGQRLIDGFSSVNLYKNESLQLIGVNNIGYTGWITISADGGLS